MATRAFALTPIARKARKGLLALDGVLESPGIFGPDDAFWVNGKEIGYFRGGGEVLGLRVTKREISARRVALGADARVALKASSDWLHVTMAKPSDAAFALELAAVAVGAHRAPPGTPAPGTPAALPPMGAKLERMRRFH